MPLWQGMGLHDASYAAEILQEQKDFPEILPRHPPSESYSLEERSGTGDE